MSSVIQFLTKAMLRKFLTRKQFMTDSESQSFLLDSWYYEELMNVVKTLIMVVMIFFRNSLRICWL